MESNYLLNAPTKTESRTYFTTLMIILVTAVMFLLPALINGFPFIFWDSVDYMLSVVFKYSLYERPKYYGLFTMICDLRLSPWPSVIAQSLITAWTVWRFTSTLFDITSSPRLLSLGLLLTLGSSLPWFVGQIMPDIFTALMILALALLCLAMDSLPRASVIMLVILISTAVAFHQANILVALWMLPALGLCAVLGWRPSASFRYGLWASAIGLLLGAVALLAANLHHHKFALSSGGSVFLMARLLEDRTALSYLEYACPHQRFAVCTFLDELRSYDSLHPPPKGSSLAEYFLWYGPLNKLGGFRAEETEANTIVAGTLSTYPVAELRAAIDNIWRQLCMFRIDGDDELIAHPAMDSLSVSILRIFGQTVYDNYLKATQIRGTLPLNFLNHIHFTVLGASFLLIIGFVFERLQKQPRALFAAIFLIVMVIGNAFILGAFSGPVDRYESRVIWLLPLLAGCFLLEQTCSPKLGSCGK